MAESEEPKLCYRIRNWSRLFENNRSRELKNPWYVLFPNPLGEDAYEELMDHEHGAAHLGVWTAAVCVAQKSHSSGTLLRSSGAPHTIDSLSRHCRIPAVMVREACDRLVSIGWIEQISVSKDTYLAGAEPLREYRGDGAGRVRDSRGNAAQEERRGEERKTQPPYPPSQNGKGAGVGEPLPQRRQDRLLEEAKRREEEKKHASQH